MLITFSSHRRWIIACLLLAGGATLYYVPYHWGSLYGPTGGSWPGLTYGVLGMVLMLYAGALGARRKVPTWRLGRGATWMKGHIWLGLLSVPLVLFHSGFQLGGTLTTVVMLLFGAVILSGLFGLGVQQVLPRMMLTRVPMETIFEQIPHVLDQLRAEAHELVTAVAGPLEDSGAVPVGSGALNPDSQAAAKRLPSSGGSVAVLEFYRRDIRPFLQGGGHAGPLATPSQALALFQHMRTLLPLPLHKTLSDLEAICEERRQLALQTQLHYWLHGWLLLHIPLSMALLVLAVVHAVIALRY